MKDHRKLKETLKEKADLLSGEHRMLFGDIFQHYIPETVKTRQKSEELLKSISKRNLRPFARALHHKKAVVGGVESVFREDQVQIAVLHQTAVFPDKVLQVKNFQKKELFSNMLPELIPQGKMHSVVEELFSSETLSKAKLAGRSKHFLKNWKKLTGDKKILEIVQDYKIPFHMDPIQVRVPHSKSEYRSIHFSESKNRKHVAERCFSERATCFRRVFTQSFSRRQIRWRKEASDKPEKPKFVYTIPAFQNGGPPSNERSLARGGLNVQDRSS